MGCKGLLSEDVYWKLEEWKGQDKLNAYVRNKDEFWLALQEKVFWSDEKLKHKEYLDENSDGKVGYFYLGDEYVFDNVELKDAVMIGGQMCIGKLPQRHENDSIEQGMVLYCVEIGTYDV